MAETDYRAICLELFGTDDVEKLKMIAKQIRQKNTRHAGRKRKFNETETRGDEAAPESGHDCQCHCQAVWYLAPGHRENILNAPLSEGYTMRMTYMFRRQPCTTIDVEFPAAPISVFKTRPMTFCTEPLVPMSSPHGMTLNVSFRSGVFRKHGGA